MKPLPFPDKLLVVPLRYIGDTVVTVPLLRNLRHHFPACKISVLVSKTAAPLLELCPYVDELITEPSEKQTLKTALMDGDFDTAIILRKSFTMAYRCRKAGIPNLIGYDKQRFMKPIGFQRWGLHLDVKTRYPEDDTTTHQAVSHLNHLKAFGLEPVDTHLELWIAPEDDQVVDALLSEAGVKGDMPIAVINSVSVSSGKSVDIERFVEPARALAEAGYQICCTGVAGDTALYERLAELSGLPLINLAGKTSLRQLYALYQRIQLLLSVDSSPIHLAAAAGVPCVIGIYSTTNPRQWGPHSQSSRFIPIGVEALQSFKQVIPQTEVVSHPS